MQRLLALLFRIEQPLGLCRISKAAPVSAVPAVLRRAVVLWALYVFFRTHSFSPQIVASHLLLYKMFDADLDVSLCMHYWFISTIVQFYICWPLIVKLMKRRHGLALAVAISLVWAALVGFLKLEESRPWSSCFLQYLWEFCLGMHLAAIAPNLEQRIKQLPYWAFLLCIVCCMPITYIMGVHGGPFKLFNDLPSMLGYAACMLLVYKVDLSMVNSFFKFTDSIGYEWFLIHGLVIALARALFPALPAAAFMVLLCFVSSYGLAYLFSFVVGRRSPLRYCLANAAPVK